jgi:nucleoid-associated protein YgaU
MGIFGKSFEETVEEAIAGLREKFPTVRGLAARISGKTVTLEGEAPSMEVKTAVMAAFNATVETDNTVNTIRVKAAAPAPPPGPRPPAEAPPAPAAGPAGGETIHVVVAGDTLGALARKYYGKASLYMKIFEANKDILKNPDVIKVGQKLRIPQ